MMVRTYRVRGHLEAQLDPLGLQIPKPHAELDPATHGFGPEDMDRPIFIDNVLGMETATPRRILQVLRETYCGPVGVEFMHIQDPEQKAWIQRRVEGAPWRTAFAGPAKQTILKQLTEAEGLEAFCQKRFVGTKRFGLEGAEVTIPAVHAIIETAARGGVREIAIGMPHRGRLNTLVNIVKKSVFSALFSEFGEAPPSSRTTFGGLRRRQTLPSRHLHRRRDFRYTWSILSLAAFNPRTSKPSTPSSSARSAPARTRPATPAPAAPSWAS